MRFESEKTDHSKSLPKDEWIDFNALFNNSSTQFKHIILSCLDEQASFLSEKDACLILPNSYGVHTPITKLDFAHMNIVYQIALDYYNHNDESRIFVKEHPYALYDFRLDKYLENPVTLNAYIPIEFYKFIPEFSISRLISVNTSTISKIAEYIKESIRLGDTYYWNFRLCHKLVLTFSLNKEFSNQKTFQYAQGVNDEFLQTFVHYCINDFPNYKPQMKFGWQSLKGDNFIILDEVPSENKKDLIAGLDGADSLTKIVFLNSKKDFMFFEFERFDLLEYITPFVIKKTALNDTCISDTDDEMLFFFCKDKAVREKAKSFVLQKSLKHTKLSLEISAVNIKDIYPLLYRREYVSRIQEINRAFESQSKQTNDVSKQIEGLSKSFNEYKERSDARIDALTDICRNLTQTVEASHKTVYESLSKSLDENRAHSDAHIDELTNICRNLTQTVEQLSAEMRKNEMRTEEHISQAVSEIKGLYRSLLTSNSWRIGRAVTWLPRKIKGLFRHS
ncbi:MAG: hypothetical protein LBH75_09220 [Treponema sp.]|nr:hypothetical protein [Treponema sp.]